MFEGRGGRGGDGMAWDGDINIDRHLRYLWQIM